METTQAMAKEPKSDSLVPELPPTEAVPAGLWLQPQEVANDRLTISAHLLGKTLDGLRQRSADWRESGAIWAGELDGVNSTAREVLFFHDLCDDQGRALSLELSEAAKFSLYKGLAARNLKLVGMIHTHPEDWVGLSYIDQANQLCSRIGFWSLVLPYYGTQMWNINTTGVHIRISEGWHQFSRKEAAERIIVL